MSANADAAPVSARDGKQPPVQRANVRCGWHRDIDAADSPNHSGRVDGEQEHVWSGWGRWLSFVVAALLILFSIPLVILNMAAAGWNIFLGLLLFAAVASGHAKAPLIAIILSVVMAIRLVLTLASGAAALDLAASAGLFVLTSAAAYQLRQQSASA